MITKQSGNGWRTTINGPSGPEVSIWAHTEMDAEYMSAMEHMRMMEREEDKRVQRALEQARLATDFVKQQVAEYRKIRARA